MERQCACCKSLFRTDRYHPNQHYCSKDLCQRKRRSTWYKNKLKTDLSYRENQADAQALWKSKNTDYWKNYRSTHPDYVANNRDQQKKRRVSKNMPSPSFQPDVVKIDVAPVQLPVKSGRYRLISLDTQNVVKIDVAIVHLYEIEQVTGTG